MNPISTRLNLHMPTSCNMHVVPEDLRPCQKCIWHNTLITAENTNNNNNMVTWTFSNAL